MLYKEIIPVCSQIHTKHINTLCGQNVEFLNLKLAVGQIGVKFLFDLSCSTGCKTSYNFCSICKVSLQYLTYCSHSTPFCEFLLHKLIHLKFHCRCQHPALYSGDIWRRPEWREGGAERG